MSFNEKVGEVSFTEFKYNNKLVAWLVAIYVALDNTAGLKSKHLAS